jgi:uncharacterized protein
MKKAVILLILALDALLIIGYLGASYYFSDIMINRETQTLVEGEAQMRRILGEINLPPPETVSIPAGEVTLAGYFYENELDGRCAVMLLHGYTGTRYGSLQYAPLFWERGCHLLAYDARGHGDSTPAYHTFGYYEKQDAKTAFDWLLGYSGLLPEQIGLIGVSYGAATALQAGPLLPEAAFIIADSAYQDMASIVGFQAEQQFGNGLRLLLPGAFLFAQLRADFSLSAVSPQTAVSQTTMPILLIHAKEDSFTLPSHSETIYSRSHPATTELHITDWGARHGMSIIEDKAAYAALVENFLQQFAPDFGLRDGR